MWSAEGLEADLPLGFVGVDLMQAKAFNFPCSVCMDSVSLSVLSTEVWRRSYMGNRFSILPLV